MRFHAPRPHFKIHRRYFNAESRHIERSEISHNFSKKYMRRQFFGGILHFCYSALNADALKLSFLAFLSKMQVPYEYLRSQTLASKFAHSTLTE